MLRSMHGERTSFQIGSATGARNYGLHVQRGNGMRILRLQRFAGFYRMVWQAVTGTHKITHEWRLQHFNFGKPLAGGRADPSWNKSARGKAMMLVSGDPFICVARSVSASRPSIGILRMKGGTLPGTSSRPRNITCLPDDSLPRAAEHRAPRAPENRASLPHPCPTGYPGTGGNKGAAVAGALECVDH